MNRLRWILVLPAAVAATTAIIGLNRVLTQGPRLLIPFPIFFSLAALAWVILGALVAPKCRFYVSIALYVIGAILVWLIIGGVEAWPYGTWLWVVGALIGGGIGVFLSTVFYERRRIVPNTLVAILLTAATIGIAFLVSYFDALENDHAAGSLGILHTKDIHGAEHTTPLKFVSDQSETRALWIWARDTNKTWYADSVKNQEVSFEWDPGSGGSPMRAHLVVGHENDGRIAALIEAYQQQRPKTWIPIPKTDLSKRYLVRLDFQPSRPASSERGQMVN